MLRSGTWHNRYFVAGLAAQKGLPIVVLPLLIASFGPAAFADYVLVYTVVQVFANLSSLGVPQAVVPLWFRQADTVGLVGVCLALLCALGLVAAVPLVAVALLWPGAVSAAFPLAPTHAVAWVVGFAAVYNLNQLAVAVARASERQRHFFASAFVGSAVLVLGAAMAPMAGRAGLDVLTGLDGLLLLQVASLTVNTVLLLGTGWGDSLRRGLAQWRALAPTVLRLTIPLVGYTLVVLYVMSVDKWAVRASFAHPVFTTYVLDYQFAFAIMFVPTAIALFFGPRVAALVAASDVAGLELEERRARRLTLFGSAAVALVMALYARLTAVPLSWGYWVLVAGFLCEGQYAICASRLTAQLQSMRLLGIALVGAVVYSMALGLAAWMQNMTVAYLAHPAFLAINLTLAVTAKRVVVSAAAESDPHRKS